MFICNPLSLITTKLRLSLLYFIFLCRNFIRVTVSDRCRLGAGAVPVLLGGAGFMNGAVLVPVPVPGAGAVPVPVHSKTALRGLIFRKYLHQVSLFKRKKNFLRKTL